MASVCLMLRLEVEETATRCGMWNVECVCKYLACLRYTKIHGIGLKRNSKKYVRVVNACVYILLDLK